MVCAETITESGSLRTTWHSSAKPSKSTCWPSQLGDVVVLVVVLVVATAAAVVVVVVVSVVVAPCTNAHG
jgi:hypothetical protein